MGIITKDQIVENKHVLDYKLSVPHIIKYMGSKRELLEYLGYAISEIYEGEDICDLFAGTSILSGSLGHNVNIHSNDIQRYSAVLANTYLGNYNWSQFEGLVDTVVDIAQKHVDNVKKLYPDLKFEYNSELNLTEFNKLEKLQQELNHLDFKDLGHHLFIKYYSGTYWL